MVLNWVSTHSQSYDDEWWDARWRYRVGLEINGTGYNKTNWPIEYEMNFTGILQGMNASGTFDGNSTRVVEYNSTGSILHELPSQFDEDENYDSTSNAIGTVVFEMNGTTQAGEIRYFYVYFDVTENGNKDEPSYSTDLEYNYTGNVSEFNVNNTFFRWYVDTERAENSSGIYHVVDQGTENEILRVDPDDNKTVEYSEFSNASGKFGFDFRNNATFKHVGPVRIVVEQKGHEIFWNQAENKTNEGYLIKRYTFYREIDWMKVEQIFMNNATYNITRNSTVSGALAFDINYSMDLPGGVAFYDNMSNPNDPGSYGWATREDGVTYAGIVNVYENGTNNFFGLHDDSTRRLGIQLNETNITAGSSISHVAHVQFNGSGQAGQEDHFKNFVNQSISPINITESAPESWTVRIEGKFYMNETEEANVFNRNETVIIWTNITDLYNLSKRVNATLDLGGAGELNLTLYDDGSHNDSAADDHVYANTYDFSDSANVGLWNVTFRVYNDTWYLLNMSWYTFNVTNVYNVTVNITNSTGFTERLVNTTVYVRNYRKDVWIPNATLNCSYDSTEIPQGNISDAANGTYYVWFTAPAYAGLFVLNCTATRNNNTGWDTEEFTSETYTTNVNITTIPENLTADNVTSYANRTFNITVIAENVANGSAYDLNITLNFSTPNIIADVNFSSCGDILISKNCTVNFTVIVLNATPAGDYFLNISVDWNNSNASVGYNETLMNITVLQNPVLNVSKNYVFGMISTGKPLKNIGNFSVLSIGNEPLQNVSFNVSGFSSNFTFQFVPVNFPSIIVGVSENVEIRVNVTNDTAAGEYNGTINVTSDNDGFKLINITLGVSGTNMTIEVDKYNYTAGNVTWYENESFPIFVNTTNIGNATAYNTSLVLNFSDANITANVSSHYCGNVPKNEGCNASFLVIITEGTPSGNYTVNVSVEWEDPEKGTRTNVTFVNITVLSNVSLIIQPDELSDNVTHGTEKEIGVIILNSTGNDPVENITFNVSNFSSAFTFEFVPSSIPTLNGLYPQGVKVNASVNFGQPPGIYTGFLNVTTGNSVNKTINLTIEVPTSRTWYLNTTYCEKAEYPEEGKVCDVFVNNTGNVIINYTISPATGPTSMYNYTWTNETNFTVVNGTIHHFSVFYNVTGQTIQYYYANYTIDAVQGGSSPDSEILQIVLNPFIKPLISIGFVPNQTEQTESLWIYANISDQSGAGIDDGNVTVNVTRPDGMNTSIIMTFYSGMKTGGTSTWRSSYPDDPYEGNWGNTSLKGYYNVTVFAIDNQGKNSTESELFYIYSELNPIFMTTRNYYYSVSGVSMPVIFYKSTDFSEDILPGTNVTFVIRNSDGLPLYNSYAIYGNLTTNNEGYLVDPEFGSAYLQTRDLEGLDPGNYTATAYSTFFEENFSAMITNVSNYTFEMLESAGVFADILVYPVWYPAENIVKFKMWVMNGIGNLTDPLEMNLSVTMPITGNPFFNRTMSQMTMVSEGVYTYTHNLPGNPTTGVYDVTLEVIGQDGTKTYAFAAFRISVGGPYDVEITQIESSVYQSDYLDFTILMENMGDAPTENLVEYWISGTDNSTWAYSSFSIQIAGGANATRMRNLPIPSYQPPDQYILNVKLTYDINNSLYASASATFYVVEGAPTPPPGPPGPSVPAAPAAPGVPEIEIVRYLPEIGMEIGSIKYPTVEVKNTGGVTLTDVRLVITGIPSPWIEGVTPEKIERMVVGNTSIFMIKLNIPTFAEAKEYVGRIIADANVTKDEKTFSLTLFTTRFQLIQWEIERLKEALQEFEVNVEDAKKAGKDVSEVEPMIEQIREQIRLAEDYLLKRMYDESLSAVNTGWSLLERARYLLSQAPFVEILIETIFPPWLIALLIVMVSAIIILVLFVKRMKGIFDRIFRVQIPRIPGRAVKPSVVVESMKEKATLEKEKANIQRVLNLLESEYKEGLISEKAYMDLRKRNEEKLAKLGERISATK